MTNVVPFSEQMGPRVWVGKQAEYPSPSWLEETRINGKAGTPRVLHVILCSRARLRHISHSALKSKEQEITQ